MVFTPPSVPPAIGGQKRQSGESNIEHFAFILHFSFFIVLSNIVTFSMKYFEILLSAKSCIASLNSLKRKS